MSKPVYYDKRSEFWREHFNIAQPYEEYIKEYPEKSIRWIEFEKRSPDLSEEQKKRVQGFNRGINILAMVGIWCGDCVRQIPMIRKIAEAAGDKVKLRVIERETSVELMEELRIVGAARLPMFVFLTEDFWEITRVGDRLLPVYRAKAAREIGMDYDAGILTPSGLLEELEAWVNEIERVLLMARLSPPLRQRHKD